MNAVGLATGWTGAPSGATLGLKTLPSVRAIEAGLANLTAAVFWSGARALYLSHTVVGEKAG